MLNIRELRIDPASLGGKKLLVDIVPAYAYADGRRTDTVTGYRYVVALPDHQLEKIGVKIETRRNPFVSRPSVFSKFHCSFPG